MACSVVPLDGARRDDFFRLHSDDCAAGWCRCVAWWVPSWQGWPDRTVEDNRRLRDDLFEAGVHDGYLLYEAGEVAGWCQAFERDRLQKLTRQFDLPSDPSAWAIGCFLIAPARRGRGLATTLLRAVIADLRQRGARRIDAFPKRGAKLDVEDLWNGPEKMFLAAGFRVVRDDPQRPVLRLEP